MLREPAESLRLVPQRDRVEVQRVPRERPADDRHVVAQLARDVLDHPVVRGRRRAQDRHVRAERRQQPPDPPVVRHELVTPVADAVRLVHDKHPDRPPDAGEESGVEVLVREPLRGDEQDVDPVGDQVLLDRRPVVAVRGVDRHGSESKPVRGLDLVAHEAQQRRHDQGWAVACVPPDAGRDPVDEALAPPRPLHDERPRPVPDHRLDRLALPVAERGARAEHRLEVGLERVGDGRHGFEYAVRWVMTLRPAYRESRVTRFGIRRAGLDAASHGSCRKPCTQGPALSRRRLAGRLGARRGSGILADGARPILQASSVRRDATRARTVRASVTMTQAAVPASGRMGVAGVAWRAGDGSTW